MTGRQERRRRRARRAAAVAVPIVVRSAVTVAAGRLAPDDRMRRVVQAARYSWWTVTDAP